MDGVCANFSGKFVELANRRFGTSFIELDQHDWDFKPWFSKLEVDTVWERDIKPTENFWTTLRPLPGTGLLASLPNLEKKHLAEATFITSRVPTAGLTARLQTCTWLRTQFHITFPNVIVVDDPREKVALCENLGIECFIDDKVSTVRQMQEASIRAYVKLSPYNCAEKYPTGVTPVETLDEFLKKELEIG